MRIGCAASMFSAPLEAVAQCGMRYWSAIVQSGESLGQRCLGIPLGAGSLKRCRARFSARASRKLGSGVFALPSLEIASDYSSIRLTVSGLFRLGRDENQADRFKGRLS